MCVCVSGNPSPSTLRTPLLADGGVFGTDANEDCIATTTAPVEQAHWGTSPTPQCGAYTVQVAWSVWCAYPGTTTTTRVQFKLHAVLTDANGGTQDQVREGWVGGWDGARLRGVRASPSRRGEQPCRLTRVRACPPLHSLPQVTAGSVSGAAGNGTATYVFNYPCPP